MIVKSIFLTLSLLLTFSGQSYCSVLNVNYDQPSHSISPLLWGIFFEEINHAGEGGLYAELIKNRAMTPKAPSDDGYTVYLEGEGSEGHIYISREHPLNEQIPISLRLNVEKVGEGGRVGISNKGFWGIPVRPDYTSYRASFYAKSIGSDFTGPLAVGIVSDDGTTEFAIESVTGLTNEFQKFEVTLTPPPALIQTQSLSNQFVIFLEGSESVPANTSILFQMVSLFPPTFKNRPNGMRIDLAQKLEDAKPSFFRFPGGNFLEGNTIEERFIWEETIGDVSMRPGHMGCWGYYSTDGLGLLEYLELSEDLNTEIILGLFAGYALNGDSIPPEEMGPYIESALNEIEYVIGNTSTVWGARRAADGHPEPFRMNYVEIGNEDWFSSDYEVRYPLFYDAISARYPELKIIATAEVKSRPMPIRDDHFYPAMGWFPDNHAMYDSAPRDGPEIFVGEYACIDPGKPPAEKAHLAAAMDDAAFMTGIERNSDIVTLACYAPLFAHINDLRWTPDGIYFDGLSSFGNAAWWVQHLFSVHRGDVHVPTDSDANPQKFFHVASKNTARNSIILKIVNTWFEDIFIDSIQLQGIGSTKGGMMTRLTGTGAGFEDMNDIFNPLKIAPVTETFAETSNSFSYNAPAFSLTIFELEL